jgi:hypothetical protein
MRVIYDTRKEKEKSSSNVVLVVVTCLSASLGILPRMPFSPVAALLLQLDRESQRIKSSSTLAAGSKVVRSSSKVINNVSI